MGCRNTSKKTGHCRDWHSGRRLTPIAPDPSRFRPLLLFVFPHSACTWQPQGPASEGACTRPPLAPCLPPAHLAYPPLLGSARTGRAPSRYLPPSSLRILTSERISPPACISAGRRRSDGGSRGELRPARLRDCCKCPLQHSGAQVLDLCSMRWNRGRAMSRGRSVCRNPRLHERFAVTLPSFFAFPARFHCRGPRTPPSRIHGGDLANRRIVVDGRSYSLTAACCRKLTFPQYP